MKVSPNCLPGLFDGLAPRAAGKRRALFQHGWTLLESAVTMALLATIAVLALSTLNAVERQDEAVESTEYLERAEDAIFGFATAQARFPAPVDALPSPGRPGVVEGWFPSAATGMPSSPRIRYAVDAAFIEAPVRLYRPDPLRLGGDAIEPRGAVNGIDFCIALLGASTRPATKAADTHLAFSLRPGAADDPATAQPGTLARTRGHGESASHLGCLQKLSGLAVAVKATAVATDLGKLADQDVAFKKLLVASAEQSLANAQWQEANLAASMTRYALDEVQNLVQLKSTPVGLAKGIGTLVTIAAAMAATAISIGQTRDNVAAARRKIPLARRMLALAIQHRSDVEALAKSGADRANRLLERG